MSKKFFSGIAVALSVAVLGTASFAAPKAGAKMASHKGGAKAAATLKCPACGMAMPSKKSKATPVAVNIKGHTYYCCAACPAGKAHLKKAAKPAAHKMGAMKGMKMGAMKHK